MQKVKITKRQRKALGRNEMVKQCKANGVSQEVGGTMYMGKTPVYGANTRNPFLMSHYAQVSPGVPFVRA